MTRQCRACGIKVSAEAVFCAACGTRLAPIAGVSATIDDRTVALTDEADAGQETRPNVTGPLAPGALLAERYRIVRALKSGGMGAVYLAADGEHPGQSTAIKEMLDNFATEGEREMGEAWFRREATMLASLQHKFIPRIHDYFVEGGRYYLAMEYVSGENLEDLLERTGTPGIPEQLVLGLGAQVCDVLTYLHSQTPPVIFRDLKPANIMLTAGGEIRLVDFGIARSFSGVRGNSLVGTPGYAPLEQYQGLTDELSDLYSLGATMHHLLTGCDPRDEPPFSFRPARIYVPSISSATERLLEGVLSKDPAERGPKVEELGRQLRRIEADLSLGMVPAVIDVRAIRARGGQMPPTTMVLPTRVLDFGTRPHNSRHGMSFPVCNQGKAELRVVMRANAVWLQTPQGQLRVPPGGEVNVPIELNTAELGDGRHEARLELEGNGGTGNIPVQVTVGGRWTVAATIVLLLILACASIAVLIATHVIVVTH